MITIYRAGYNIWRNLSNTKAEMAPVNNGGWILKNLWQDVEAQLTAVLDEPLDVLESAQAHENSK